MRPFFEALLVAGPIAAVRSVISRGDLRTIIRNTVVGIAREKGVDLWPILHPGSADSTGQFYAVALEGLTEAPVLVMCLELPWSGYPLKVYGKGGDLDREDQVRNKEEFSRVLREELEGVFAAPWAKEELKRHKAMQ